MPDEENRPGPPEEGLRKEMIEANGEARCQDDRYSGAGLRALGRREAGAVNTGSGHQRSQGAGPAGEGLSRR